VRLSRARTESTVTLRLLRGDLTEAEADVRQILDEFAAPLDPQSAAPVFSCLAEIAIWENRGLAALADADEPYWLTELCRTGLAVEAAAAEQARARHAGDEERAARELAAGLVDRSRAAAAALDFAAMPTVEANLLTAEAEWSESQVPAIPTGGSGAPGHGRRSAIPG
jgi:hypothetical protein